MGEGCLVVQKMDLAGQVLAFHLDFDRRVLDVLHYAEVQVGTESTLLAVVFLVGQGGGYGVCVLLARLFGLQDCY